MKTIKDIIDKFDEEFLSNSNDDIISVFNEDGKGTKTKFKQFLQSSLTSLLDSIKEDLLLIADKGEYEDLRREVTNYFNSHR